MRCRTCNKAFVTKWKRKRWCGECSFLRTVITRACSWCATAIISKITDPDHLFGEIFCGEECKSDFWKDQRRRAYKPAGGPHPKTDEEMIIEAIESGRVRRLQMSNATAHLRWPMQCKFVVPEHAMWLESGEEDSELRGVSSHQIWEREMFVAGRLWKGASWEALFAECRTRP